MKKYCFSLLAAVATLFAASCSQNDELVSASGNGEQNVTFSVQLPGAAQTRAIADGVEVGGGNMANTLICALYEQGKTSETPLILKEITEREDRVFELQLPMAKDLTYEILFMAYNKENCAFNVNFTEGDLTSVNLQALTLKSDLKANQEAYDVFVGRTTHKVNDEAVTLVKLNRPFGQVNAATTLGDLQNAETLKAVVTASSLELKGVPTTYNIFTGEVSGSATLTYKAADILKAVPATTPANEKINVEGEDYYYLAMAYVLAGNGTADKSLHDATFKFNRADGTTVSTVKVANMPIQRNYRTNVVGELLTHAEGFKVVVDEVFKEPAEGVSYWDGKTMKEPAVENGAYVIRSAAEFAWLSGKKLDNNTINLEADINMGGYEIKTIASAYDKTLTFNGNGHTIADVIALDGGHNSLGVASLFQAYTGSTLTISDLTVDGVRVDASSLFSGYAAALVAYNEGTTTLTNITVKNSTILGTNKVGALVGYATANSGASLTATNCKVTGCTVSTEVEGGEGQCGGLIGYAQGNTTLTGCVVEESVVKSNMTESSKTFGKYIGTFHGSSGSALTVTGAEIKNVTVEGLDATAQAYTSPYGDFLGGWRIVGGTVSINGVKYDKVQGPLRAMIGNASYATLGEAINAAQAGDEIVLADGTYEGCFKVGKDLTISAMNEGQAIINGMMYAESEKTLKLNGLTLTNEIAQTTPNGNAGYNGSVLVLYQANVIADKCTFNVVNSGTYAFANKSSDENNYSTFTNCTFNCNGERAIHSKTNIKVDYCTFNDPRSYCIQLRGQGDEHTTRTNVIFTNNQIFDACKTSGKPFAVGLEISANQQFGYVDIQVANNKIDEGTLYFTYVDDNFVDWTTCNITGATFVKETDVVTE